MSIGVSCRAMIRNRTQAVYKAHSGNQDKQILDIPKHKLLKCVLFGVGETTMNIRLLLSGLIACVTLCTTPQPACAKIFPKVFVTTRGGTSAASASPFGGNGTIDSAEGSESDPTDFGTPVQLLQNLAMPIDIAVSSDINFAGDFDDIIYAVIGGK